MLKVNVGLTKKVGQPDFGSRGASVTFEVEVESNLVREPDQLRDKIRYLFGLAKEAVEEELNGHDRQETAGQGANGHHSSVNGNTPHQASAKQVEYAQQLAKQVSGLGVRRLETLSQQMHAKPLAALSSIEASALIDVLKDIKAGKIDVGAVLNGAAA